MTTAHLLLKHRSKEMQMAGRGAPASRAVGSGSISHSSTPVTQATYGQGRAHATQSSPAAVSHLLFIDLLTHSFNKDLLST